MTRNRARRILAARDRYERHCRRRHAADGPGRYTSRERCCIRRTSTWWRLPY